METIKYIDRATGDLVTEFVPAEKTMKWLYGSPLGKATLNLLMKRKFVSALGGWYMNRKSSRKRIAPFVEEYSIDMSVYSPSDIDEFKHFNDFFYRKIKPEARPIGEGVVSPADGKVLAFQSIEDVGTFFIKGSAFTLADFLVKKELADRYAGGAMFIVRLAPTDYHRYHFPEKGKAGKTELIKGDYFSVSPIALQKSLRIFCENKRTHSELETENHGNILIVEVGATMVGSILQTYTPGAIVEKGSEKGYFAFGGSTVVLLFEKDKVKLSEDLLENTQNGLETQVKMGETIGL